MADPFAAALGALFASPMAVAAVYTPPGGAAVPVQVVRSRPTLDERGFGQGSIVHDVDLIEVRVAELATVVRGAGIAIGPDHFVVVDGPDLDVEGLTWRAGIAPA